MSIAILLMIAFYIASWIFGFIQSRKIRQLLLIPIVLFGIGKLIKDDHEKQSTNAENQRLKNNISRVDSGYNQLKKDYNTKVEAIKSLQGEISDLDFKAKVAEELAYREYALYSAVGEKNSGGLASINGVRMFTQTPLTGWNKSFVVVQGAGTKCKCSHVSLETCRAVIEKFPQYPFPYYFLAKCLKEKGDPSWKGFAETAGKIFSKTTQTPNHHKDHDAIANEVRELLNM